MNKFFILIVFLLTPFLLNGQRRSSERDSIYSFLTGIGEVEPAISEIIENSSMTYSQIFETYLHGYRLNYIDSAWYWSLSSFEMNSSYLYDRIIQDTITILLHPFYTHCVNQEEFDSLSSCSWYTVEHFNCVYGAFCYYDACKKMYKKYPSQNNLCAIAFAAMAESVLFGSMGLRCERLCNIDNSIIPFDSVWYENCCLGWDKYNKKFGSNNHYFRYAQMVIHSFNGENYILILSSEEKLDVLNVLDEGISQGSRECLLTKAFALITGVVLDENQEEGKKLLLSVWPEMSNSPFWDYIEKRSNGLL